MDALAHALALAQDAPLETGSIASTSSSTLDLSVSSLLSEDEGIRSYADLTDAHEELEAARTLAGTDSLIDAAISRIRRKRKPKRYDDFVTDGGGPRDDDGVNVVDLVAKRMPSRSMDKRKIRTVMLNFPPKRYDRKVSHNSFVLRGGRTVLVRNSSRDALVGVDETQPGKFRARYASTYLGRFTSADEAARTHDDVAVEMLEREGKPPERAGPPKKKNKKNKGKPAAKVSAAKARQATKVLQGVHGEVLRTVPSVAPAWLLLRLEDGLTLPNTQSARKHSKIEPELLASFECSFELSERDVCLCASRLELQAPPALLDDFSALKALKALKACATSFTVELVDEHDGRLLMVGHYAREAQGGGGGCGRFLRLEGRWGQYARSRRLSAGDVVTMAVSLYRQDLPLLPASTVLPRPAELSAMAHVTVGRSREPPPVAVLEPNVETEVPPKDLGLVYVPGLLRDGVVSAALRDMEGLLDLPRLLKRGQMDSNAVRYRVRIVQSSPEKGRGVWLLEKASARELLFDYSGEVVGEAEANRREKMYRARRALGDYFVYDLKGQAGRPHMVVDATHFGNVGRFVNHSCDPNLEIVLKPDGSGMAFMSTRSIQAGEELTVDYSFGKSELKKTLSCHCGAECCRGWVF